MGKVGEEAPESTAIYSLEEAMAKFRALNNQLVGRRDWDKCGVGSLDIKSLFPRLSKDLVKRILTIMILRSEVEVEGVD